MASSSRKCGNVSILPEPVTVRNVDKSSVQLKEIGVHCVAAAISYYVNTRTRTRAHILILQHSIDGIALESWNIFHAI